MFTKEMSILSDLYFTYSCLEFPLSYNTIPGVLQSRKAMSVLNYRKNASCFKHTHASIFSSSVYGLQVRTKLHTCCHHSHKSSHIHKTLQFLPWKQPQVYGGILPGHGQPLAGLIQEASQSSNTKADSSLYTH